MKYKKTFPKNPFCFHSGKLYYNIETIILIVRVENNQKDITLSFNNQKY